MPVRSAGDDDHEVPERRLSSDVDGDDILGFGVLEACEDQFESAGGGIGATFQALREDGKRLPLGVYCCQGSSFLP
jgi:hypothetical protein